jgi:CRISPR type III-A/MTUBE-associated RAMP protein Csm3
MLLKEIKQLKGEIHCQTGLHIGASNDLVEIGGIDLPVIKHPITREPYIPGSSLKGKMRHMLEKKLGRFGQDRYGALSQPCGCGKCIVCKLFGAHQNVRHGLGPTRLIVRDCELTEKTREEYNRILLEKSQSYLEVKTENVINRASNTAEHPRYQERVPSGTRFGLDIAVQIYDVDDEEEMMENIKTAMRLVEQTYLGGYGSRGSGKVAFENMTLDGQPFNLY